MSLAGDQVWKSRGRRGIRRRVGIPDLRRGWISRVLPVGTAHGRGITPVGRPWRPHHAVVGWRGWIAPVPVRGRRISRIRWLLVVREVAAATASLRGRRYVCVLLVIPPDVGHTQLLKLAPPNSIPLVLAIPGPKGVIQKLHFQFRPTVICLRQYAIDLAFLFERPFSRAVVLLVPTLIVGLDNLPLRRGPFRLRPLLDFDHPGPVLRGAGPRVGVLAGTALKDLGRDVAAALGLDVDLEVADILAPGGGFGRSTRAGR